MTAAVLALRSAQSIVRQKRDENFRAIAALAGWAAWRTTDDHGRAGWILTKSPRTQEVRSTEEGETFIDAEAGGY